MPKLTLSEFLEKIDGKLREDYEKYIVSENAVTMAEKDANYIVEDIKNSKYLYFVARVGNIWTLETDSGLRFPIRHIPFFGEEYYNASENYYLEVFDDLKDFYQKHYKIDENTLKFNTNYLPEDSSMNPVHKDNKLHIYQPIKISIPEMVAPNPTLVVGYDDKVVLYMVDFELISDIELSQDKEFLCKISDNYTSFCKIVESSDWTNEEMLNFLRENNISEMEFEVLRNLMSKKMEALSREAEYLFKVNKGHIPEHPKRRNDKPEVGPLMEIIFDELADYSSKVTGVSTIKEEYSFLGYDKIFLSKYHTLSLQRLEGDKIYETTLSGNEAGDMFTTFKCEIFENLQLLETINVSKRKIPKELRKAGEILQNEELFEKLMVLILEEHINFLK